MKTTFVIFVMAAVALMAGVSMAGELAYTVYGVAHVSTDMQNNGDTSEIYVSSNTNRVGIKGSMATNSDLFTVIFQYESQADFNAGIGAEAATWVNRNSYAGLKGDWGSVIWGRNDTPFKTLGRQVEYFAERVGDARNATQYFGLGWDNRVRNMVMYTTPKLGEMITVAAQYVPDQGVTDCALISGSAMYDKDGIKAGIAFENHGKALEAGGESATAIRGILRYQSDLFSVGGLVQTMSNNGGVDGISGMVYGVGADYLLTPVWDLKGQVYMLDPDTDTDDDGATMVVAGVDYILSDAARLYLAYATMMNEDGSARAPFAGGHGQSAGSLVGESPYGASVGLTVSW